MHEDIRVRRLAPDDDVRVDTDVERVEAEAQRAAEQLQPGVGIVRERDLALERERVRDAERHADAVERERDVGQTLRIPDDAQPARRRARGQQLGQAHRAVRADPAPPVVLVPEADERDLQAEAVEVERDRLLQVDPSPGDLDLAVRADAQVLHLDRGPVERRRADLERQASGEQQRVAVLVVDGADARQLEGADPLLWMVARLPAVRSGVGPPVTSRRKEPLAPICTATDTRSSKNGMNSSPAS